MRPPLFHFSMSLDLDDVLNKFKFWTLFSGTQCFKPHLDSNQAEMKFWASCSFNEMEQAHSKEMSSVWYCQREEWFSSRRMNDGCFVWLLCVTGGRGKDGAPIITFPEYSSFGEVPDDDFLNVVTYLTSIPRYTHTLIHMKEYFTLPVLTKMIVWHHTWDWGTWEQILMYFTRDEHGSSIRMQWFLLHEVISRLLVSLWDFTNTIQKMYFTAL